MTAPRLTRRSLLAAGAAAGAGAVAGGLTRPGGVLAALARPPRPLLEERWVGALPGTAAAAGARIELTRSADLIGLGWQGPADARPELRFRSAGGDWSEWVGAGQHGHGPDRPEPSAHVVGDPLWTGGAVAVALRAPRTLSAVRLHLVDVSAGVGAHRQALVYSRFAIAAALPLLGGLLDAGPGQPPILARRSWARGIAQPRVAPEYGVVRMAFVHHTENPNGYLAGEVPAMLRAIFAFHRYVHGWNDIGYNFVVDSYGRIFEARAGGVEEPVIGAHAGGYNLASTGVAVLGSFSSQPISAPARRALERLLAWKLCLHGVPARGRVTVRVNPAGAVYSRFPANALVPLARIAGHRDGDSTDCPGDALYAELPGIRRDVHRLAPRPARVTLALGGQATPSVPPASTPPASTPPASTQPASTQPTVAAGEHTSPSEVQALAGVLEFLDGMPIAGAPIALQARSVSRRGEVVRERTIAQALTDGAGRFSLPAASIASQTTSTMWLRALYLGASVSGGGGGAGSPPAAVQAGAAAVVSDPLRLAAAPLSPAAAVAPTQPTTPPR